LKKVQVLLSTYNGEQFIQQQLDSLFNQTDVEVFCLVRDDGSSDNTMNILLENQEKYKNIKIISGKHIGYKASFFELIKISGEYDYYAFSDQDDVWESFKLIKAIEKIDRTNKGRPVMYFSNATVVDENLKKLGRLHSSRDIIPSEKTMALVQGFAHGCTLVFNHRSKDLILKYRPKQDYPHDFWIPLLHMYLGYVIYDQNSYILYRQHKENVFGKKRSFRKLIRLKLDFIIQRPNFYSQTAKELLIGYGEYLDEKDYQQLMDIADYKCSIKKYIKLLFNKNIKKNTFRGTFILKILILLLRF